MNKKYFLPLFFIIQIVFLQWIQNYPNQVENYFSTGFYPKIAWFSRTVFGSLPFSVGDVLYTLLIFFTIRWFWKKRKTWKSNWKNNLLQLTSALSIFYFFFYTLWAFNYFRVPLFDKMNIKTEYNGTDLLHFTNQLIQKTNALQLQIAKKPDLKVTYPYTEEATFKLNLNGFNQLSSKYPFFSYSNLSVKRSLFSLPLSYMGFGGYLNPFTNEAQINDLMPIYNLPFTSCHEMAHQMGYASESECNFISFLATTNNPNQYAQYAGYSYALRYCLGILSFKNEALFKKIKTKIHPGVLKNYHESEEFWAKYESPIETGFEYFYDHFLKMNQQKDGLDSYSKFVDLLINYYKDKPL